MRNLLTIILLSFMVSACGKPVNTETEAINIAKKYVVENFEIKGNKIDDYRVKVWDERVGSEPFFSVYFVHKNKYDSYANEKGEIVDAYAPIPPESIMIDVYTKNGKIDASTNYER